MACIVGDGEAETGPLAASWHSNKFLDPVHDGAVLPILHLNGYKIANPTVFARIPESELIAFLEGYGYASTSVCRRRAGGDAPGDGRDAGPRARRDPGHPGGGALEPAASAASRPTWPMIVLRSPKGWTGPKVVDGKPVEGTWRSHQVPISDARNDDGHRRELEQWLRSYRPDELFDADGRLDPAIAALAPVGERRMSANPHANGGLLLRELELPDFRSYAVDVAAPGATTSEATRVLGAFLRDVIRANPTTFRLFGPDETDSNRLSAVLEATDRVWQADILPTDEHLARAGRVLEVLSEHLCQGWLEGYLLTGRHGLFNCYEAFIHIIDSMFNQHAKWLKVTRDIPWRRADRVAQLPAELARLAPGPQRLQPPGPGLHRPRREQEGRRDPRLPAARREHAAVGDRPLPAVAGLRERRRRRQAADDQLAADGRRDPALHARHRDLGLGRQRRHRRAGRRARLRRRRPDAGDAGGGRHPARGAAGPARARRERGRPDAAAGRAGAPARPARRRVRRAVHDLAADHLRLPRLPVADPPPHVPPAQPRQPARPRLQGGGHHHHALRHGHAQRHGPVPPRHGRHRPGARPRVTRRPRPPGDGRPARAGARLHPRVRRRPAGDPRLDLAGGGRAKLVGDRRADRPRRAQPGLRPSVGPRWPRGRRRGDLRGHWSRGRGRRCRRWRSSRRARWRGRWHDATPRAAGGLVGRPMSSGSERRLREAAAERGQRRASRTAPSSTLARSAA